jgi:hypothetical protein
MTMLLPMTVVAMVPPVGDPLAARLAVEAAGELDVHLDGALELGAVGEDDARGAQVAADAGALVEGDGGDATMSPSTWPWTSTESTSMSASTTAPGATTRWPLSADAALDAALDDEVFFAGDVAADGDPRADVTDALGGPGRG